MNPYVVMAEKLLKAEYKSPCMLYAFLMATGLPHFALYIRAHKACCNILKVACVC